MTFDIQYEKPNVYAALTKPNLKGMKMQFHFTQLNSTYSYRSPAIRKKDSSVWRYQTHQMSVGNGVPWLLPVWARCHSIPDHVSFGPMHCECCAKASVASHIIAL